MKMLDELLPAKRHLWDADMKCALESPQTRATFAVIDSLFAPDPRHAWIERAAEQIRQWRAEDEANGQPWGDEQAKDGQ